MANYNERIEAEYEAIEKTLATLTIKPLDQLSAKFRGHPT